MIAPRGTAGLAVLLAALSLPVFWPATGHEFISYDDPIYVTNNPQVLGGLSVKGLRWSLTTTAGGNWHPLTWWSHMVDAQIFGDRPAGHHATSVVVHAASAALLFVVLTGMTGARWPSAFVAGLFALHPLHVESVAWVSERKDVLVAFFWMVTLGVYLRYVRRPARSSYLLVIGAFVMALMSKPMAVTLPLILLALDLWPLGRFRGPHPIRRAGWLILEKLPLLALAAATGFVTILAQRRIGALQPIAEIPEPLRAPLVGMRVMNAAHSCLTYLVQTAWPVDLAVFYPHPAHELVIWRSTIEGLALAVATVLAALAARRAPYVTVGWTWYLLTLLPVIGLLQVGAQAHADRYTYLPLTGVFLIVGWGVRDLGRRRPALRGAFAALASAALMACAALSLRQLAFWRNELSLFEHAAMTTSGNYVAFRNLGESMLRQGDYVAAERYFREEVRLSPRSTGAYNRLGMALGGQGRREEAIAAYREAVRINPGNFEAQNNLGMQLTAVGGLVEAEEHLRAALRLSPGTAEIHVNLGDNLAAQQRPVEALESYQRALHLKPGLAQILSRLDRPTGQKRRQ